MERLERVFIALGSNIAPRRERLAEGRAILKKIAVGGWKESRIYETPPLGPKEQGPYLNQVVSFWYFHGENRLLYYLKGAELLLGRKPRGHWLAREIDLDLLYYGKKIRSGRPTLPHKELARRQFVLVPLCDIEPDWVDPLSGISVRKMLNELQSLEGEQKFKVIPAEGEA